MKTRLLASGFDLESIKRMIRKFFYSDNAAIEFTETTENVFDVWKNGKRLDGYLMRIKANRFRFEMIEY